MKPKQLTLIKPRPATSANSVPVFKVSSLEGPFFSATVQPKVQLVKLKFPEMTNGSGASAKVSPVTRPANNDVQLTFRTSFKSCVFALLLTKWTSPASSSGQS